MNKAATTNQARGVTVVIPTLNNLPLLRECLRSLRQLDYPAPAVRVIVVDNGNSEAVYRAVHAPQANVICLSMERNTGFAAACNRGAAEASTEYVAFLNDDAMADPQWLNALFAGLDAGGEGAVCAASRILSGNGSEIEYNGASSNLFGVGRPRSVWGWPEAPEPPKLGSPLLFASGGAMLVHRRTFLDAGGFDPEFFAYFEDVDLGWRLWALGYKVVYAPEAVVRHIGGSTGSRQPAYRRYTLWECNSLAAVLKNYEGGNMERILSGALLLLYKRALLSAGDAFDPADYRLTAPPDTNTTNVERLPQISVAHLAAIDRFNSLLPHFMEERRRIQGLRKRPDSEILPLMGRLWEPQYAGQEYAEAARQLASALNLYGLTEAGSPNRVLILADHAEPRAMTLAARLAPRFNVALVKLEPGATHSSTLEGGFMLHRLDPSAPELLGLQEQADAVLVLEGAATSERAASANTPTAFIGGDTPAGSDTSWSAHFNGIENPAIDDFCRAPGAKPLHA